MTTVTVNSQLLSRPLFTAANSTGYARCKFLVDVSNTVRTDTVDHVTMTVEGSGYTSPPLVGFSGGGGVNAAGIAVLGFAISSVTVVTAGSYATIPTLTPTVGSGATLTPSMKLVKGTIVTGQSSTGSYAPSDTITLAGGTSTAATVLTVTATYVQSATVANPGDGSGAPGTTVVIVNGGVGVAATLNVTIDGSGHLSAINSVATGGDYTTNPTIAGAPVTGGALVGATVALNMGVLTFDITTPGSYTVLPSNPIAQGSTSGSGTGFTCNGLWGITSVAVGAGGQDFDSSSVINITGGGSTGGGACTLTLASSGGVKAVVMTNGGTGYVTAPTVAFSGGGGTLAAGTAVLTDVTAPITIPISVNLPTSNYAVITTSSTIPGVISFSNKTTTGFDLVLTPLSTQSLAAGTMDLAISFCN